MLPEIPDTRLRTGRGLVESIVPRGLESEERGWGDRESRRMAR